MRHDVKQNWVYRFIQQRKETHRSFPIDKNIYETHSVREHGVLGCSLLVCPTLKEKIVDKVREREGSLVVAFAKNPRTIFLHCSFVQFCTLWGLISFGLSIRSRDMCDEGVFKFPV